MAACPRNARLRISVEETWHPWQIRYRNDKLTRFPSAAGSTALRKPMPFISKRSPFVLRLGGAACSPNQMRGSRFHQIYQLYVGIKHGWGMYANDSSFDDSRRKEKVSNHDSLDLFIWLVVIEGTNTFMPNIYCTVGRITGCHAWNGYCFRTRYSSQVAILSEWLIFCF